MTKRVPADIVALAKKHGIADAGGLHATLRRAPAKFLDGLLTATHDTSDNLDVVAQLLSVARDTLDKNALRNGRALTAIRVNPFRFAEKLERAIDQASRAHRPARRGRVSNKAVYAVVELLARYWENDLGRKFTRHFTRGQQPKSAAAKFVWDCFSVIFPNRHERQGISRAMARFIAAR
jgi:hypothetical protein